MINRELDRFGIEVALQSEKDVLIEQLKRTQEIGVLMGEVAVELSLTYERIASLEEERALSATQAEREETL